MSSCQSNVAYDAQGILFLGCKAVRFYTELHNILEKIYSCIWEIAQSNMAVDDQKF